MIYVLSFVLSLVLSIIFTLIVKKIAIKMDILDKPGLERKIHNKPIPLLGGIAIFSGFFLCLAFLMLFSDKLFGENIHFNHILAIFIAGLLICIGGFLDDKYNLSPMKQLVWPILAILTVIVLGISVNEITNPFGGIFKLNYLNFNVNGIGFSLIADLFIFLWLLAMMYTTKLLDGMDGLVTGMGAIGSLIIFLLCIATKFYQPDTALLALIFSGACLGFLIFNFNPAKIFLGESGSLFIGFMLGLLAIISGGKIATALLIMGIPMLDAGWVILRRIFEGKSPFKTSDRKHLHHRLLDSGMSQKNAALFMYVLAAGFGATTLFLQSKSKLIALGILFLVMLIIAFSVIIIYRNKHKIK